MNRRIVSLTAVVALLFVSVPGASAAPLEVVTQVGSALDTNRDKISDNLEAILDRGPDMVQVIVSLNRPAQARDFFGAVGPFAVSHEFSLISGFSASMSDVQVRALAQLPTVFRVQEDRLVSILNNEANAEFGTAQARNTFGLSGLGVTICILDTGIDATHEQLDDGKVVDHYDPITNSPTPIDDQGHGTHVAATAAGDGFGSSSSAGLNGGVAPGASLLSAKVLNSAGSGSESEIILGMEWCLAKNADILSMSIGTTTASDGSSAMDLAADNAVSAGAVVVVAAGNSGDGVDTVGSPGASTQALTVGAAGKMSDGLRLAPFSSRGPLSTGVIKPDIVAPGMSILSAAYNTTTGYSTKSGTSMATPFMAGTVALALQADSSLSPAEIKSSLSQTAIDLGGNGPDGDWGAGLVDGFGFVSQVSGTSGSMDVPTYQALSGTVATGSEWFGSFNVTSDDLAYPAAVTLLISDTICTLSLFGICFAWGPDIDVELIDPAGTVVAVSQCPLSGECYGAGHQETFVWEPNVAGLWQLRVYPFDTDPGSPFTVDVFTGPPGGVEPPPPDNTVPIAKDDAYSGVEDVAVTVGAPGVLQNDTDADAGDVLTVASWSNGSYGTVTGEPDGSFVYQPAADFNGTDSFSYSMSDNQGGTDTGVVSISISPVNDVPVADDDVAATEVGVSVIIDVAANDTDVDGNLVPSSAVTTLHPALGTTVDNGDGTITYLPARTFIGVESFEYQICDDAAVCDVGVVTVTVSDLPVGDPVVFVTDLDGSSELFNRGRWRATVTVTVSDGAGSAVAGAVVTFDIDGSVKSCTTDDEGACSVRSRRQAPDVFAVIFTVTDISADGLSYDPNLNSDLDFDSTGTAIGVLNPGL